MNKAYSILTNTSNTPGIVARALTMLGQPTITAVIRNLASATTTPSSSNTLTDSVRFLEQLMVYN